MESARQSNRRVRGLALAVVLAALVLHCAGKSTSERGSGASGGTAGVTAGAVGAGSGGATAGRGGTGGTTGGTAGTAGGTAGTAGGTAGTAGGTAGSSGSAGAMGGVSGATGGDAGASGGQAGGGTGGVITPPPGERECEGPEDCVRVSDCCGCRSEPQKTPSFCALDCERDACVELGLTEVHPTCDMGRCRFDVSCDRGRVGCEAAPPSCPPGQVPSVVSQGIAVPCWGPCIDATDCGQVTDCSACPDGTVCIVFEAQFASYSCVVPQNGCAAGKYCSCLAACSYGCTETEDYVACACPVC